MRKHAKPLTVAQIADRIQILESSGGKFDGCRYQGKVNTYGYGQSAFSHQCFQSEKLARMAVMAWFSKNLPVLGLEKSLCFYNQGLKINNCEYAKKFKSL